MTAPFEFAAPSRVVFGRGRLRETGSLMAPWGPRCLLFTGAKPERADTLVESLRTAGVEPETIAISGEPTFDLVRDAVRRARDFRPDCVVGFGGGSVIDAAKATAMLIANGGDPLDYAEVIGAGRPVTAPSVPFVAIPTTAGAGAEATRNAVLVEPSRHAKVSLRSHLMLPSLVVIDPATTISLPADITAATGMDALSQLIEAFVSVKANPATDALCRAGIARAARSLRRACESPTDLDAREDMALAAWWSGMALANAGLGAVHGFAAALGGLSPAPHGLICATFLAPVCRANAEQADAAGRADLVGRLTEIAALLTGRPDAAWRDGVRRLEELACALPLTPLRAYGIDRIDAGAVLDAAIASSSMKGNPVPLSRSALAGILTRVGEA